MYFGLLILVLSSLCFSENKSFEFLIRFKSFNPSDQDSLHQKVGSILVYRSKSQKVDVIQVSQDKICEKYLTNPGVEKCEANTKMVSYDQADCDIPGGKVKIDSIEGVAKTLGCSLFLNPGELVIKRANSFLTPYWAQEAIGADLSKELMDNWDATEKVKTLPVPVGIIDAGIALKSMEPKDKLIDQAQACRNPGPQCPEAVPEHPHGNEVAHLMMGPSPVGVGHKAMLSRASGAMDAAGIIKAADNMLKSPNAPKIVNISMGAGKGVIPASLAMDALKAISNKSLLVSAAGNGFPDTVSKTSLPSGIIVGSTKPDGTLSDFSQEGEEVHITAPSDYDIMSIGYDGLKRFGGTSGATPEVSGAIANVMSFLPDITVDEVKKLLKKSAIKTSSYLPPNGKNGAGQLNAYKMVHIAAQLKRKGWPLSRELLNHDETYDLKSEAQITYKEALKLLEQPSCEDRKKGLKLLRKSFLMDPENLEARKSLAEQYGNVGFKEQATFYQRPPLNNIIKDSTNPLERFKTSIRHGIFDDEVLMDFKRLKDSNDILWSVSYALEALGKKALPIEAGFASYDPMILSAVLKGGTTSFIPVEIKSKVYEAAMKGHDEDVKVLALARAAEEKGAHGVGKLAFNAVINESSLKLKTEAINKAWKIFDEKECLDYYSKISATIPKSLKKDVDHNSSKCFNSEF